MVTRCPKKKFNILPIFENKSYLKLLPAILVTLLPACETVTVPQEADAPTPLIAKSHPKAETVVREEIVIPDIWFDRVSNKAIPSDENAEKLCRYISEKITSKSVPFPTDLELDRLPRIIFVSVNPTAERTAAIEYGTGKGFRRAVDNVLSKLIDIKTVNNIKLDIVTSVQANGNFIIKKYAERQEGSSHKSRFSATAIEDPSLQGIAFHKKTGIAFLNSELMNRGFVDDKKEIQVSAISNYLSTAYRKGKSKTLTEVWLHLSKLQTQGAYLFKTRSYTLSGSTFQKVFRNHTIQDQLTLKKLQETRQAAQKYISKQLNAKGEVNSHYNPCYCSSEKGDSVRAPLMTLNALLSQAIANKKAQPGLNLAIHNLVKHNFKKHPKKLTIGAITDGTVVNLESNAEVLRVLLKHQQFTQQGRFNEQINMLSLYIKKQQKKDGSFIKDRMWKKGTILNTNNQFFSGQILQALLDLYEYKKDSEALEVAKKYLNYLVPRIGNSYFQFCADPGLLTATVRLQKLTKSTEFRKFTIGMANAMMAHQNSEAKDLDVLGSFQDHYSVYYTAEASRALTSLYKQLAVVRVDRRLMSRIQDTIVLANLYLLQNRFDSTAVMYFATPQKSIGGFRSNVFNPTINSDTVCAAIKSLESTIALLELLKIEELPTSTANDDTLFKNHNYIDHL